MPTDYPGSLDSFTNPTDADTLDDPPHHLQHTDINDAMEAVQGELGLNPRGAFATVRARLDAIDARLSLLDVVYFTSSGFFEKGDYPGIVAVMVECQGGGAGGSGLSTAVSTGGVGGGGGGGGYAKSLVLVSDLAVSEAVTVGNGGNGGASGGDNPGAAGGDSIFDTISGEVRGMGGSPSQIYATGDRQGGLGGDGVGDLVIPGGAGNGPTNRGLGWGGGSHLGAGARPSPLSGNFWPGQNGRPYGGGGSGANVNAGQTAAGGDGAPGIVIVTVYGAQ